MSEVPAQFFGGSRQLLSLIDLIYATVNDPSLWTSVMNRIEEATGGELPSAPEEALVSMTRVEAAAWGACAGFDGAVAPGMVGGDGVYLASQRPARGVAMREVALYDALMPHMQRALQLRLELEDARGKVMGLEAALDRLGHAVFGLDADGRVVMSNERAIGLTRAGDTLAMRGGRLSAVFGGARLEMLLQQAEAGGIHSSVLVHRPAGRQALRVTVMPFEGRAEGSAKKLAVLVFVSDPEAGRQTRGTALRALYGLTPTEVRVADLLVRGLEIKEVAEEIGVAVDTARFHTKSLLAKTGSRRQVEMMRLMLSLPQG